MSKFGWNLPPGCRISDIPGNRPEDQEQEAFMDAFYSQLPEGVIIPNELEDAIDKLCYWSWQAVSDAYGKGYKQGQDDERMAREYNDGKTS